MKLTTMATAAVAVSLSAGAASAVTITAEDFTVAGYNAAFLEFVEVKGLEDWEDETDLAGDVPTAHPSNGRNIDDGYLTGVGAFSAIGGTGSGGTVTGEGSFDGNDGSKLALRDGNVLGRASTTDDLTGNAENDQFLDSNDTFGIGWNVNVGSMFNTLLFTLADATDVGALLTIATDYDSVTYTLDGLSNGNNQLVEIVFDEWVSDAYITFSNTNGGGNLRINDGFSIDDLVVGLAPVPLPAAAWLMIAAVGGLGAVARRKRT